MVLHNLSNSCELQSGCGGGRFGSCRLDFVVVELDLIAGALDLAVLLQTNGGLLAQRLSS
jgi:hypothetical protein